MDESIFDCSICADKLNDAMETKCCHHCFCKRCIDEWMQLKKSCPSCRMAITAQDIVPNVPIQRIINNLPDECPNKSRGCSAKLTRGIVKDHVLNSCEFAEIVCPNQCGAKVSKRELSAHQSNVCSKRLAPCAQCMLMVTMDAMLEHRQNWCLKALILCPHCNITLCRERLYPHQHRECMKITLKCPFAKFGCQFTGLRPKYNKHLIEDSDLHVGAVTERQDRMSNEITKLKNELAKLKSGKDRNKFNFEDIFNNNAKKDEFVFKVPDIPLPANNPNVPPQPKPSFAFAPPQAQPSFGFNIPSNEAGAKVKQPFVFNFNP